MLMAATITFLFCACGKETKSAVETFFEVEAGTIPDGVLSTDGSVITIKLKWAYVKWMVEVADASEGENFITTVTPEVGGDESEALTNSTIRIKFAANKLTEQNSQEVTLFCTTTNQSFSFVLTQQAMNEEPIIDPNYLINSNPSWTADARCFYDGPSGAFDDMAVKDPSVVYYNGKYHLFYTGRDTGEPGNWRTGYVSAETLEGFNSAERHYLSSLNGGSYFCAPQVFYFPNKQKWYLIYQSGQGATYSTNDVVDDPVNWTAGQSMGFGDGIDFWCISDGNYIYCFYSAQDGSHTIKRRRTSISEFPLGWGDYTVVATESFEAPHVYKNKANGKYYMVVEDIARRQELWEAETLDGTFTKLNESWAGGNNLVNGVGVEHWTDQVSHVELIRSGCNEYMEVNDMNECEMLIQGVVNGDYGSYGGIPYDIGLIKNY